MKSIGRKYIFDITRNNRGSAVIELSFIMPIVLGIIVLCIFLFIDSINDSIVRCNAYTALYTYNLTDNAGDKEEEYIISVNNELVGVYSLESAEIKDNQDEVSISIEDGDIVGGTNHQYKFGNKTYKTEFDLCTKRLRRWQLYGDVVQQ